MMRLKFAGMVLMVLAVGACARPAAERLPYRLSPEQAVFNAAGSPGGVSGTFEMVVRATGNDRHGLYLNSELDYRDPRNLTIAVPDGLVPTNV